MAIAKSPVYWACRRGMMGACYYRYKKASYGWQTRAMLPQASRGLSTNNEASTC